MDIILFTMAGLIGVWIIITMIKFMGIKEFITGVAFIATLFIVVCGILRGAANKVGCKDKLPAPWSYVESVLP